MENVSLKYHVSTLDNHLLLPAGTRLSADILEALIVSGREKPYKKLPLLQYGSIKDDLLHFLNLPPYQTIFSDKKKIPKLLKLMESVHLVGPVLESMDYFKHHDPYTYHHILNVFALSTLLAMDMVSVNKALMDEVSTGPVHDIGKICVPLHILKKARPLTATELKVMKHHAAAGYVLLSYYYCDAQSLAAVVARDHHERIVAVSDIFDALISPRPYRPKAYDNRTALEEIIAMAEKGRVGWDVVKALVAYNRKSKPSYHKCKVSKDKRGTPPSGNYYGVIADEKQIPDEN
ncbi:MAG: hypothetical protein HY758_10400 [Nitrospirae bacterium]|nr:hypothetical protein [Nitrospirota bacterium]